MVSRIAIKEKLKNALVLHFLRGHSVSKDIHLRTGPFTLSYYFPGKDMPVPDKEFTVNES